MVVLFLCSPTTFYSSEDINYSLIFSKTRNCVWAEEERWEYDMIYMAGLCVNLYPFYHPYFEIRLSRIPCLFVCFDFGGG